jgi:hypothetical protein
LLIPAHREAGAELTEVEATTIDGVDARVVDVMTTDVHELTRSRADRASLSMLVVNGGRRVSPEA